MTSDTSNDSSAQPSASAADQAMAEAPEQAASHTPAAPPTSPREFGGRKDGTEPTRYGDWEKHGRCIDF